MRNLFNKLVLLFLTMGVAIGLSGTANALTLLNVFDAQGRQYGDPFEGFTNLSLVDQKALLPSGYQAATFDQVKQMYVFNYCGGIIGNCNLASWDAFDADFGWSAMAALNVFVDDVTPYDYALAFTDTVVVPHTLTNFVVGLDNMVTVGPPRLLDSFFDNIAEAQTAALDPTIPDPFVGLMFFKAPEPGMLSLSLLGLGALFIGRRKFA